MRDFSWFGGFDYWLPENPNARYQQLGAYVAAVSQSGNSFHPYQQRNFIRLQEVSLAYNVPKLRLRKLGVNHARIFISGTNLLTITKWDGWDPESGAGIGAGYPTLKNYSMGLNFEF
jgi:hypothetical protein